MTRFDCIVDIDQIVLIEQVLDTPSSRLKSKSKGLIQFYYYENIKGLQLKFLHDPF